KSLHRDLVRRAKRERVSLNQLVSSILAGDVTRDVAVREIVSSIHPAVAAIRAEHLYLWDVTNESTVRCDWQGDWFDPVIMQRSRQGASRLALTQWYGSAELYTEDMADQEYVCER